LLFADHVETLVNTLLANPQFDGAYSTSWEVVTDFNSTDEAYKESGFKTDIGHIQEFNYEILLKHNFMTIQSVLFKISLYKEFGGFYENIEFLEDWTLWVRYASKNGFIFVPKTTSMYRTPANPLQIINRNRTLLDAREIALNLNQKFLEKKN
jgi:hypothetical protein